MKSAPCPRCGLHTPVLRDGQTERDPTIGICKMPTAGNFFEIVKWADTHGVKLEYSFQVRT